MIRKPVVLITGAGGEIGHGLIERLVAGGERAVITLDVNPLDPAMASLVQREFTGSILDETLLDNVDVLRLYLAANEIEHRELDLGTFRVFLLEERVLPGEVGLFVFGGKL